MSSEFSCHDAVVLNCVYVRKSSTHLDRDVGQRPPTLTEVISAPRQGEAHPRDASFLKDLLLSFPSHATKPVLVPFVKTIPQRLRVSFLRKKHTAERFSGFFTLEPFLRLLRPFSVGNDHVLSMHFRTSHDATVLWIFVRLFIWSELPETCWYSMIFTSHLIRIYFFFPIICGNYIVR